MPDSVYIHIPFCKSKCKYCSFTSFSDFNSNITSEYIISLCNEIKFFYKNEYLKTLYIGGGTPSLLKISDIETILKLFKFSSDTEITIEINPDDMNDEYAKNLRELGINRLSLGVQTFDNETLKIIGRRHSANQVLESVDLARRAGFENINLDLIYGLPQIGSINTHERLINDIKIITNLNIPHISTYGLKIEEPSFFFYNPPKNLPNDDEQADMYLLINKTLADKGYYRYEISNFSKPGFESKHNLNYWNNSEYYGFGIAAHGYLDCIRYSNFCDFERYINNPFKHAQEHMTTKQEQLEEEIFLGFRREYGILVSEINKKFEIDFEKKYSDILEKYCPKYIQKTKRGYKLTIDGVLLSNNILAEFLE